MRLNVMHNGFVCGYLLVNNVDKIERCNEDKKNHFNAEFECRPFFQKVAIKFFFFNKNVVKLYIQILWK